MSWNNISTIIENLLVASARFSDDQSSDSSPREKSPKSHKNLNAVTDRI